MNPYTFLMKRQLLLVLRCAATVIALSILAGCVPPAGAPVAVLTSDVVTGPPPLEVTFDISATSHPQDDAMTFTLDFGDGTDSVVGTDFDVILHHEYTVDGTYQAILTVRDSEGDTGVATLTVTVSGDGPPIGINVGQTAPDFTGHRTDGGTARLSDYRGQVVLLDFWGAWCPPCRNSMPHLDDWVTTYGGQGLVAIIVSTDTVEQDAIDFLDDNGLTQFISIWEPGGKYANPIDVLYDVTNYPTTFLIDRQGVIRWISIGYPGTLTEDILEGVL